MTSSFPRVLPLEISVSDLAAKTPGIAEIVGARSRMIGSVAPLGRASKDSLSFCRFTGEKAAEAIRDCNAGVIITSESVTENEDRTFVQTPDPRGWFIDALGVLFPEQCLGEIDATVSIHPDAIIGENVALGAYTVIGAGAVVGDDCRIGTHCHVEGSVTLAPSVTLRSHAALGGSGLAFHERPDGSRVFFPHLGRVLIGTGTVIGSHAAIMQGIVEDTIIGQDCMIGNQSNVGHNVRLGDRVYISSGTTIAGAAKIGDDVTIGADVSISSHVEIGQGAVIGIGSVVVKPVADAGRVFGNPAKLLPGLRKF